MSGQPGDDTNEDDEEHVDYMAENASAYSLRADKAPPQEVAGALRVLVMSASGLAVPDRRTPFSLKKRTANAKAILRLKDEHGYESQRFTNTQEDTLNPVWCEEFRFAVNKHSRTVTLEVDVEDDHADRIRSTSFLGVASISLDMRMMKDHSFRWCKYTLKLLPDKRSTVKPEGQLELRIYWEPWGWRSGLRKAMASRKACGILGSLLTAGVSPVLELAAQSRWLCVGDSLHSCRPSSSGIRQTATDVASIGTKICGVVHFLGAMGILGPHWEFGFPKLFDLLEDPEQEADARTGTIAPDSLGGAEKGLDLHVLITKAGTRGIRFNLGVGNLKHLSSKTLVMMLRYIAWVSHVIAISMLSLALGIAFWQVAPGHLLAEGAYLTVVIDVILMITFYVFWTNPRRGNDLKKEDDFGLSAEVDDGPLESASTVGSTKSRKATLATAAKEKARTARDQARGLQQRLLDP